MINTNRISSGFDVELQLGSGWFQTALTLLADNDLLVPGVPITIESATIIFEDNWDLRVVTNLPPPFRTLRAAVAISVNGDELTITTDNPGIPPKTIPFGALKDLPQPPVLVKLPGDGNHEDVLAVLANLDIQVVAQSQEPRADDDFFARGDSTGARSFLRTGSHIAFGMGGATYQRFANNLWHTQLRATDGTHPLPNAEEKVGDWSSVSLTVDDRRLKLQLEGDIPVDSPIIDIIPDPHVTVTIWILPRVNADGNIEFEFEKTEANVDTGILGDLFAGFAGGLVGLIIGFFTGGGFLLGLIIGVAAVFVLEAKEDVAGLEVNGLIQAKLNGQPVRDIVCCENGIVQVATPNPDSASFNLGVLDTIPTSIPIHMDRPDDELYHRTLLVSANYDDLTLNDDGFGIAGQSIAADAFRPVPAEIRNATYDRGVLQTLEYLTNDDKVKILTAQEVFERAGEVELKAPFRVFSQPSDVTFRVPAGKLATVCLHPRRIHREETIIKEIEFDNGLHLKVPDAVALQDAAASVVPDLQLIHPRDYHAYYRARADDILGNNLEWLETY